MSVVTHGTGPFTVAAIHGGPGAAGSMQSVARRLSVYTGILEPLQTANNVADQIHELRLTLLASSAQPAILIGHSWGAWLAFLCAAHHPELVKKIIMIGSGPFEERFASNIMITRKSRLSESENAFLDRFWLLLASGQHAKADILKKFTAIMTKADSYKSLALEHNSVRFDLDIYNGVWPQASALRKTGELLRLGSLIKCPVVAIHGDFDPHPAQGVAEPLAQVVKDFRFILLEKCGHTPWNERYAAENFYSILHREIQDISSK